MQILLALLEINFQTSKVICNLKKTVHIPESVYSVKEFKFVHNSLEETFNYVGKPRVTIEPRRFHSAVYYKHLPSLNSAIDLNFCVALLWVRQLVGSMHRN